MELKLNTVYLGDALESIKTFPDESIDCVVTSPPYYGLRDYGTGTWEGGDPNCDHEAARQKTRFDYALDEKQQSSKGTDVKVYDRVCPICGAVRVDRQIGLEDSPDAYIERLVTLFREIRRVLKKDGTLLVNLGDSYNSSAPGNKTPQGFSQNRPSYIEHEDKKMRNKKLVDGVKPKDLIGIPWMFAFAMRQDGWYLRQDIIWAKPNPMPESVTDRCTKSHEYIFLFSKSERYYFDYYAIQEEAVTQLGDTSGHQFCGKKYGENDDKHFQTYSGNQYKPQLRWGSGTKKDRTHKQGYSKDENGGHRDNSGGFDCEMTIKDGVVVRNKRDVWTVHVRPNKEAHFATYPQELIVPCILAGSRENGVVLDPFMGSGTTGIVARKLNRNFVGCELNPEYQKMATRRIFDEGENLFNQ